MSAIGWRMFFGALTASVLLEPPPDAARRRGGGGGGAAEGGAEGDRMRRASGLWNQNPSSRYLDFFCSWWDGKEGNKTGEGWGVDSGLGRGRRARTRWPASDPGICSGLAGEGGGQLWAWPTRDEGEGRDESWATMWLGPKRRLRLGLVLGIRKGTDLVRELLSLSKNYRS